MSDFTISQDDARVRINAWRKDQTDIKAALLNYPNLNNLPCLNIHAFTFTLTDLKQLCNRIDAFNNQITNPPVVPIDAIRFYLGEKQPVDPNTPKYACLIPIAVQDFEPQNNNGGKDLLNLPVLGNENPPSPNAIYDFSFPCPSTCAEVNHSIMDGN